MRSILLRIGVLLMLAAAAPVSANVVWRIDNPPSMTGWTVYNVEDNGVRNIPDGGVMFHALDDLYLLREVRLDANRLRTLVVDLTVHESATPVETLQFFFAPVGHAVSERTSITVELPASYSGLVYLPLHQHPSWRGEISTIRLDPINTPGRVELRGIALIESELAAPFFDGTGGGPQIGRATDSPGGAGAELPPARLLPGPPDRAPIAKWDFHETRDPGPWRFFDETGISRGIPAPIEATSNGLVLVAQHIDPQFVLSNVEFDAAQIETVTIELEVRRLGAQPVRPYLEVYWMAAGGASISRAQAVEAPLRVDDGFHAYTIQLRDHPEWRGRIAMFRIDPGGHAPLAATIRRVAFH